MFLNHTSAQYNGKNYSVGLYYNYTVTSLFFDSPRDPDRYLRIANQSIDGIGGYSADFRYGISESIILGLTVEYMKSTTIYNPVEGIGESTSVTLSAEDGYEMYPVELSFYYLLPFSTDEIKFVMGGGFGIYTGDCTRKIGNLDVTTVERDYDLGLHVNVGIDYLIEDWVSIRGQLRFRDPQFEMKSEYNGSTVIVDDEEVLIRNKSFYSKINVDGIIFNIGAVFHF